MFTLNIHMGGHHEFIFTLLLQEITVWIHYCMMNTNLLHDILG